MALSFPSSPSVGQQSTQNGRTYSWTGSAWELVATGSGLTWSSVPASATGTGTAGSVAYDGSYFYLASAQNTWVRAALSTWALPVISIGSQPSNQTASSGAATFSVTASVTQSATLSYQWQKSTNSGSTWTAISGATSASLSLTGLTTGDNSSQYRVVVSATGGASNVTSSAATLTVVSFTASAVLLTSGTSYTVPSGATSMKAWAVGQGAAASYVGGGAGGVSYKTWSVSGGQSVSYSVGAAVNQEYGAPTTVTFSGTTITGSGGVWGPQGSRQGGSFSGGDGGATGGDGYYTDSWLQYGGAVGGNGAEQSCGRRIATNVSGLLAAVALAGASTTESCGSSAAFGSGGFTDGDAGIIKPAGLGGGGGTNTSTSPRPTGAVVLYFT